MVAQRETRWQHFADTIRLVVLLNWKIVLFAVALVASSLLVVSQASKDRSGTPVTQQGRIERFGFRQGSRNLMPNALAIVRLADGRTEQVAASPGALDHCRVGDRITYTRSPEGVAIDRCAP